MSIGNGTEKKSKVEITKELLHQKYSYCPIDIARPLVFRSDTGNKKMGESCGALGHSYYGTSILGKSFFIHRLVWLYKHPGCYKYREVPAVVDHINRNPHDNRYENLRAASQALNSFNSKRRGSGTSSFRGVCWSKLQSKWVSQCNQEGKVRHKEFFPGTNAGEIEAALAYDRMAFKAWGQDAIPSLNFPEEKANYMGLNEYQQLEFGFCDESPAQQVLDLNDVVFASTPRIANLSGKG